MDLALTPEQQELRGLAREIFTARCTDDRLREVEAAPDRHDPELWAELARANILGVGVPEALGGIGGGIIEACVVLEEAGRVAAPVPLWPAMAGAMAVARADSEDHLASYAAGGGPVIPALAAPTGDDPYAVHARVDGEAITATLSFVPDAERAAALLVPARGSAPPALYLVEPRAATLARQTPTGGTPTFEVVLDGAPATRIGGDVARAIDEAIVALCAWQLGLAERALEMTAAYTSEREQFGKPIATFQAVQQRAADAFIDVQAMRWTMWEAAWRLSEGLDARERVRTAKVWAAEGAARVLAAAQHLHGGIGVDTDYPLHRYTFAARQGELILGAADAHLQAIGDALA
jgi:alkylation response protein AidB-like acyl-CoA dehydrogenase